MQILLYYKPDDKSKERYTLISRTQNFTSRQQLNTDTFEIFHYRDEKPFSVGIHHHDFYEIYLFLEGDVTYRVEGRNYILEPGDLLLINPAELHQPFISEGAYERIVLWINKEYLENLSQYGENLLYCFDTGKENKLHPDTVTAGRILEIMKKLSREFNSKKPYHSLYATGLFYQLLVEVNRLSSKETASAVTEKPDLSGEVVRYINENFDKKISLDTLSKEFFVSKYHLSHEFKAQYGTGIYKYITLKRLLIARELLADGERVGEVYKACGFNDYTTFFRAFKAEYSVSPADYCKQLKERSRT